MYMYVHTSVYVYGRFREYIGVCVCKRQLVFVLVYIDLSDTKWNLFLTFLPLLLTLSICSLFRLNLP